MAKTQQKKKQEKKQERRIVKVTWIVVVNRTQARIYQKKPFVLIQRLENEIGREKNRAMTSDKPSGAMSAISARRPPRQPGSGGGNRRRGACAPPPG